VTVVGKLKTRQKEVGFQVLVGAAQKLQPSLDAGAVGAILAFACPAPTACYEIYAAWKEGDTELARLKQERIAQAAQRVVGDLGVPGVKYGMDFNGYYGGPSRLPFLPLTGDLKAEIELAAGRCAKLAPHLVRKRESSRPTLPASSEEMKAWSAALGAEVGGWPKVSARIFFEFHRNLPQRYDVRCLAANPRDGHSERSRDSASMRRAAESAHSLKKMPALAPPRSEKARWFSFELSSDADLHDALDWLAMAYEAAGKN
jgi:hypothetical protein